MTYRALATNAPRHQHGLTLIEVMIALVIGLILIAGAGQIFIASKQAYRSSEALSRVQEAGRTAMLLMARDIRQAGYWGCSRDTDVTNWLDTNSGALGTAGQEGMGSTEGGGANGSDSISLRYARSPGDIVVTDVPSTNAANFKVNNASGLSIGDVLVVSDCSKTDIVQVTNIQGQGGGSSSLKEPSTTRWARVIRPALDAMLSPAHAANGNSGGGGGSSETVNHNPGGSQTPGNKSGANKLSSEYTNGANVYTFHTANYSVVDNGGTFELRRNADTIATGVRQLQLEYGYDSDADGIAEFYGDANAGDPQNAVSVRIRMLVQSQTDNVATEQQTVAFDGNNVNIPNGRVAQVFTTTIAVRNRLP